MSEELEQMSPNQRRALDKALSALEAFASIWAAEIRLSELSARIAAVPAEAERAKRIAAMIEQGFIEGAYRHYLDHKDKCDELAILQAATRDTSSSDAVDAQRYRWLRDQLGRSVWRSLFGDSAGPGHTLAEIDQEIDATIAASAPKESK